MRMRWLLGLALLLIPWMGTAEEKAMVGVMRSDHVGVRRPAPPDSALSYEQVEDLVRAAVEAAGLEGVVRPEHRWIVIKPNIVEIKPSGSGVITDARVVKALVKIVHEIAPEARITIAEGSGGWVSPGHEAETGREGVDGFKATGYRDLLEDPELAGVQLELFDLNFDESELLVPKGGGHALEAYWIPKTVLDCDVFINVPVLKTIRLIGMTVGMKNLVGIAPGNKYGWGKDQGEPVGLGQALPHAVGVIDEMIVDLASLSRVNFTVVDAIVGMERHKTDGWGGVPVRMNTIVAGGDLVAVDAVCARLMGLNPDDIETITWAAKLGLGVKDMDRIEIRGDPMEKVARRFEKPPWDEGELGMRGHYGQSVRTWLLKGPFSTKDFEREFLDPEGLRVLPSEDGWSAPTYFHDDRIDLREYFGKRENCVAYAYTRFTLARSQDVELWVGSGEDLRIWIDQKEVYTYQGTRRHMLPNDRERVWIEEGEHGLLIKVGQRWGKWDFSLNLCEPEDDPRYDGNRVFGLTFHVPREGASLTERTVAAREPGFELEMWRDAKGRTFPFEGELTVYTSEHGLLRSDIRALALSPDGALWAAGPGGLSRFDGAGWASFPKPANLPWRVHCLAVDASGTAWYGTQEDVLRFDGEAWSSSPLRWCRGLNVGRDGAVWAGTWEGLKRFDGTNWTPCPGDDAPAEALCLAVDSEGVVWAGTWGDGVAYYDGEAWRYYSTADGLGDHHISSLAVGSNGEVWAGTDGGGVSRFAGRRWHTYRKRDGLGGNGVRALTVDREGKVWALVHDRRRGRNALAYFDRKRWVYAEPEQEINDLLADPQKGIWLAAERSVVRILP